MGLCEHILYCARRKNQSLAVFPRTRFANNTSIELSIRASRSAYGAFSDRYAVYISVMGIPKGQAPLAFLSFEVPAESSAFFLRRKKAGKPRRKAPIPSSATAELFKSLSGESKGGTPLVLFLSKFRGAESSAFFRHRKKVEKSCLQR